MRRRGLALILVVGVLAVLAVLGSAFAVLSRLERRAAQQRVNGTRALLLARSGLEDARVRLDLLQDPVYGGEDWNADGAMNAGAETDGQVYRPSAVDLDRCPAAQALRPSFFRAAAGNPRLVQVDGRARGYTGSFSDERQTYSLRALSGGFCVNGGDPAAPASAGYNAVLRRVLGTLAEAVGRQDALPVDQSDGEKLVDLRPASGWVSFGQVRDLALGGSPAKLEALRPYLALDAWVDRKVIAPNLDPAKVGDMPETWVQLKQWRLGGPEPGFERINGRVVGRPPVSLAWARRRRPALIALLAGLKGAYLDDSTAEESPRGSPEEDVIDTSRIGTLLPAEIVLDWAQASDECRDLADSILGSTSELGTWEQWNAFCDTLPTTGTSELPQAKRDVLKAAFNPNSDLNKANPDRSLSRLVDKSDLLRFSTELSLTPCAGWELSCVGRVLDRGGRLLSLRTLSARLAPDAFLRLTTQGELVAGELGRLEDAGDESAWRSYGDAGYITESLGSGRTYGHRLSLGGYLDGDAQGVSLQTSPEPHPVWTSPATGRPAAYDGQLRLATVESSTATSMLFLARWAAGFDSDDAGGITPNAPVAWEAGLGPASPLYGSPGPPGLLMTDGLYLEKGDLDNGGQRARTPAYPVLGNMHGKRGTISFWVKPNHSDASRRSHFYFNATRSLVIPGPQFIVALVAPCYETVTVFGVMYRTASSNDYERANCIVPTSPAFRRRWNLFTYGFDMEQPATNSAMVYADRGQAPYASGPCRNGDDMVVTNPATVNDFSTGGNKFHLGRGLRHPFLPNPSMWSWPDATLDELAIYDFGPDTARAQTDAQALALGRFQEGRFYKESAYAGLGEPGNQAGEWLSAPIRLGTVRLLGVSWTQVLPRGLRAPGPVAGEFPEDGDPGPDGRILVELASASGAAYLRDASGRPLLSAASGPQAPAWSGVDRRVAAPFRLHAVFQPNLASPMDRAVVDPLALDDVTLTYRDACRSPFASWREGE